MKKGDCIGIGKTAEVYEWGEYEVLKLFYPGQSIGHEAENTRIIHSLGIPIPEVIDVVEVEGRQGIIYERVKGTTMTKLIEPTLESFTKFARQLAEIQSDLHSIKIDYSPNLRTTLLKNIGNLKTLNEEQKHQVISLINQLPDGNAICHFDLHPDNIMITEKGPIIIDWTDVLIGHPLADVCWTSLLLKSDEIPAGDPPYWLKDRSLRSQFHDIYFESYFKQSTYEPTEIDNWRLPIIAFRFGEIIDL